MKSLNEQLAELCGYPYITNDLGCFVERATCKWIEWNPTTDLNQLRMCFEAAEKGWDTDKHMESFGSRFATVISVILANESIYKSDFAFDVATIIAWVKHPELVAQAILKAKEVI